MVARCPVRYEVRTPLENENLIITRYLPSIWRQLGSFSTEAAIFGFNVMGGTKQAQHHKSEKCNPKSYIMLSLLC